MTQPADAGLRSGSDSQLRQGGRALLLAFYTALRSLKLYPVENATVQKALDDLDATARALLAIEGVDGVNLSGLGSGGGARSGARVKAEIGHRIREAG